MDKFEQCWMSGNYDGLDCYGCPHRDECSGSNINDDDE